MGVACSLLLPIGFWPHSLVVPNFVVHSGGGWELRVDIHVMR